MKFIENVSKYFYYLSMVFCFLLMLYIVLDVILRFIDRPLLGTSEMVQLIMVIIVFSGIAYTDVQRGHVAVDVVVERFSKRTQAIIDCVVYAISLLYIVIVVWQSSLQVFLSMVYNEEIWEFSMAVWPWRAFVPVGCTLLAINMAFTVYKSIKKAVAS